MAGTCFTQNTLKIAHNSPLFNHVFEAIFIAAGFRVWNEPLESSLYSIRFVFIRIHPTASSYPLDINLDTNYM